MEAGTVGERLYAGGWGGNRAPSTRIATGFTGLNNQQFRLNLYRHFADVVVIDLRGKATIGHVKDILNKQLRQLIGDGTDKILVNLTDVTQLDSSSIRTIVRRLYRSTTEALV